MNEESRREKKAVEEGAKMKEGKKMQAMMTVSFAANSGISGTSLPQSRLKVLSQAAACIGINIKCMLCVLALMKMISLMRQDLNGLNV